MIMAFEAVCRHKNITAAARELGLTQPAVSKSLKKLEEICGEELIIRSLSHIEPSTAGIEMLEKAHELINICEDIARNDKTEYDPLTNNNSFTIATPMVDSTFFFKALVLDTIDHYPLQDIDLVHIPAFEAYKYLESKYLDFYLGYRAENLQKTIEIEKVFEVEFTILCSPHSPLYKKGTITRDEFVNTRNINIYKQFHELVLDEELKRLNLLQKDFKYVPNQAAVYKLLLKTDFILLETKRKAKRIIQEHSDLKILEPEFDLPAIPLYLMWHRTNSTSAPHSWLRSYIKEQVSKDMCNE